MTSSSPPRWRSLIEGWGPAREALWVDGRSISFHDVAREMYALDDVLERLRIVRGDVVGVFAPPSEEGFPLIHALLDRGVVMMPLNLRWTADELRDAIDVAAPRWIVVTAETQTRMAPIADSIGIGLLELARAAGRDERGLLRVDRAPDAPPGPRLDGSRADRLARDAALVLFTSGTSGRSKAAVLTWENLRASAQASIELLGRRDTDRWLCCLPLFHIGGLSILIRAVMTGTSVALHEGFDVHELNRAVEEDRITRVSLVATMLTRLLDLRGERAAPSDLDLVLLGGGPASQALLSRAHRLGYPVAPTYGLTEAASQVATCPPRKWLASSGDLSGGLAPLPGTEIRIVEPSDSEAAEGSEPGVGEIEVRGPTVMAGYLGDPAATARALRAGWLRTGDLGMLDDAGCLRVFDRRSDLIVSGGENVYPAEIESTLLEHPAIAEAGVVGIADAVYGARPKAFVVAAAGRSLEPDSALAFCRERLAPYKVPVEVVLVDSLPRTASGKLRRRELAASASRD